MRVFLAVKSLLPSYGGPAFSVSQLAFALADAGIEVGLWASDMSTTRSVLSPAHRLVRPMNGPVRKAINDFGRPDILHDNGIWLPHNHRIAELAARENLVRVVSVRGMLEPWAMNHKRWKKKLAWWFYQRRDLRRASYHHATAQAEAQTLQRLRLGVPVRVIPNGINIANVDRRRRAQSELRTALFLGRLHPIKGLLFLIEAWARVRPAGWRLKIAGPDEVGHQAELEKKISAENACELIEFLGPLDNEAKKRAFLDADIFLLPSFSESFGMAVAEALAHGVPVLTTTGTPWHMLSARGCGWRVNPTVDGLAEGLRQATSSSFECLLAMGERGRDLIRTEFSWGQIVNQFLLMYEALLVGTTY
jgi:glycosyltransferase involved in cell wall biosynthesis